MSFLITDIESIADLSLWTPPPPDPQKPEENPVAPQYAQRPIVIGAVWLDRDLMPRKVGSLKIEGGPKDQLDEPESRMLASWNEFVGREKPQIVTWYGRGFDMPVITLRSMKYGIQMPWYYSEKDFRYRYSEAGHLDLCDAMSDYGASRNYKLDAIAKMIGLPGKPLLPDGEFVDGSKVAKFFEEGRLSTISDYCITDCLQTAWVFMRWRLLQGKISHDQYRLAARALLTNVEGIASLAFFRKQINDRALLLLESP